MRRLSTGRLIRIAVIVTVIGLLLLIPVVLTISGLSVGLFMLGSLLIMIGIALYVGGVIQELRRREAI